MSKFSLEGKTLPEIKRILQANGFGKGKIKVQRHHEKFKPSKVGLWGSKDVIRGRAMTVNELEWKNDHRALRNAGKAF